MKKPILGIFIVLLCIGGMLAHDKVWTALKNGGFTAALGDESTASNLEKGMAAFDSGDYAAALRELPPLAEAGDASAQFRLGVMYQIGEGIAQDDREAVKWYTLAAEQGDAGAQFGLSQIYAKRQDVPLSVIKTYLWLALAALQGHEQSAQLRDSLVQVMSAADLAKAEPLAQQCLASGYQHC